MADQDGRLHHIKGDALTAATAQTSGMQRLAAISGATVGSQSIWMGRTHVPPHTDSGPHHHGRSETGIFVVTGHPVFIYWLDGGEVRVETAPGDFIFVPAFVPHRETNPFDEEAVVVIARSTQEAIVENLDCL